MLVIFGYLGHFSSITNIQIQDMPLSGPDLVFITIPGVLSFLPFQKFWLFLFMITLLLLGFDTMLALVKCIAYIIDDCNFTFKGKRIDGFLG